MNRRKLFDQIQLFKPKRSKFDLSHERKMTIPFGALIPTLVMEILPGDSTRVQANILGRFQAGLAPFMHRVDVYTHYFYVPYRIVSSNFTRAINFQGNRPNLSTYESEMPYFTQGIARSASVNGAVGNGLKDGSLLDYLGFPTAPNDVTLPATPTFDDIRFSALLPLAYQRVWNDYYRDQNYTRPLFGDDATGQSDPISANWFENTTVFNTTAIPTSDNVVIGSTTPKIVELLTLRFRAWEKDYLTSALPYANQGIGDPRVPITVPIGALGNAPAAGNPIPVNAETFGQTGGNLGPGTEGNLGGSTDLGGFTISALRVASSLKRWLENSARGGVRYIETLWHHWYVKSSDARLQRAEYLGGGLQPMVISEVVTTSPATAEQNAPPGYLAGHGVSFGTSNRFTRRLEEHGVILGITSVLPRTAYLYSMPRAFMRQEPLDFAWPEFAQIGEQAVLGAEVAYKLPTSAASTSAPNYGAGSSTTTYLGVVTRYPMGYGVVSYTGFDLQNSNPEGSVAGSVWGFQSRYAEYKYMPDTVHGLFRNNQSFWHFGRMFSLTAGAGPSLNNSFVTSNPRTDGFAVLPSNGLGTTNYDQHPIMLQVYNKVSMVRSLPYFNTPQLW